MVLIKVARMVCFDSKKRALLDDACEKGTSIGPPAYFPPMKGETINLIAMA